MPRAKPFSSSFNRSFRIKPCCLAFPSPRRSPGRPIARTIGRKSYRFTSSRRAPGPKGSRVRQLSRAGARARALPSGSLPGRAVCARDRPRVFAHRRGGRDPWGGGTLVFFCCGMCVSCPVCGPFRSFRLLPQKPFFAVIHIPHFISIRAVHVPQQVTNKLSTVEFFI